MQLALANSSGQADEKIEVSDVAFGREYNEPLVRQVVTSLLANMRQGSKAQKTRSDCRGGGAKPWRQKGTGRARAGTSRSPIWRSGGVTFAARPRDYTQKINKKMYRLALQSVFSELVRQDRLVVVKDFTVQEPKTKLVVQSLKDINVEDALIIKHELDEATYLAARNVPRVMLVDATSVTPLNLLKYSKVVLTEAALKVIEEVLK